MTRRARSAAAGKESRRAVSQLSRTKSVQRGEMALGALAESRGRWLFGWVENSAACV